jgi:hypothetical protein
MKPKQPRPLDNRNRAARCATILISTIVLFASRQPAAAQPITYEVLDYAEVTHRDVDSTTITVHFRFPVAYETHFPAKSGEVLMVKIRPTTLGNVERDPSRRREAVRPPAGTPVTDIVYDEESLWDPYLILHFTERVEFHVRQGRDGRSIAIDFLQPPSATPALHPSPSPASQ